MRAWMSSLSRVGILVLNVASILLPAAVSQAQTIGGDTTGQPIWNRPQASANPPAVLSPNGTATPYQAIPFTVTAAGSYTFDCTAAFDCIAVLYQTSFNAATPLTNALQSVDPFPNIGHPVFSRNLTAGTTYFYVATGFGNGPGNFGTFSLAITSTAGTASFGAPVSCDDCTYINGVFDFRTGQLSHLGGASPHGAKAADDFFLCDGYVYDVKTFSATLMTTTFFGLVKAKAEIWSDNCGCPGTLLYTFENPLITETGLDIGPAFDGRPLRVVNATFDVTRETIQANRNVVLKGGRYWLSIYGLSDNLGPTMQMYDVTYWGTAGNGINIKGKPAHKVDGNLGNAYPIYNFPSGCGLTAWHSVTDDCCIGCTDLNFNFCTTPCKILIDNGDARTQVAGAANGSTSKFAPSSGSAVETRSADDFFVPPCQDYHICYVEACILTNCPTFEGVFELYSNDCNKPSYALNSQPLFNTQYVATKIVPLGALYNSVLEGKTVYGYRLEFHDLNFDLPGGRQYWISAGVRFTFSINERAFFCYNSFCDGRCPIHFNEGRVLTATSLDSEAASAGCISPAPVIGCNGWAKVGNDFSFLIAADGRLTPGPIVALPPTCAADFNSDGSINPQDIFDYLNAWFSGCP